MTNQFPGLARGPIDHNASSVINQISADVIDMGSVVHFSAPIPSSETLPRVFETTAISDVSYAIAVGGDTDGIYGDGTAATDDSTRATSAAGQGVVVVTQGRCLARVRAKDGSDANINIDIGGKLAASSTEAGVLVKATLVSQKIIATALQFITSGDLDIIAVDVQREGLFS